MVMKNVFEINSKGVALEYNNKVTIIMYTFFYLYMFT